MRSTLPRGGQAQHRHGLCARKAGDRAELLEPEAPVEPTLVAVIHAAAEGLAGWWLATGDDAHVDDVIQALSAGLAAFEHPR